jgi:hypothetical protein
MDWILVLILVIGGYQTISLVLAHREKMSALKLGVKLNENDEE